MKIKKIEQIETKFDESSGPYEIRRLGIAFNGYFILLGEFYFGPGMNEKHESVYNMLSEFASTVEKLSGEQPAVKNMRRIKS